MITTIESSHPVVIRRVADDGRRTPPALSVTLDVLTNFRMIDSYEPGGAPRLAATLTRTTRPGHPRGPSRAWPEWMDGDEEMVIIDQGLNSGRLLSALGHGVQGHSCPDCSEA